MLIPFLLVFLLIPQDINGFTKKPRSCCKYKTTDSESTCPTNQSCSLKSTLTSGNIHPNLEQCSVLLDTKREEKHETCREGEKFRKLFSNYLHLQIW